MELTVTGKIVDINPTVQVSERFKKRTFALDITEEVNGNSYANFALLQASQNKCEVLDHYKIGDAVKVSFNIRGSKYEKDGKTNYFTTLDAWKIEKVGAQPQQAPQQGYSQGVSDDTPF